MPGIFTRSPAPRSTSACSAPGAGASTTRTSRSAHRLVESGGRTSLRFAAAYPRRRTRRPPMRRCRRSEAWGAENRERADRAPRAHTERALGTWSIDDEPSKRTAVLVDDRAIDLRPNIEDPTLRDGVPAIRLLTRDRSSQPPFDRTARDAVLRYRSRSLQSWPRATNEPAVST